MKPNKFLLCALLFVFAALPAAAGLFALTFDSGCVSHDHWLQAALMANPFGTSMSGYIEATIAPSSACQVTVDYWEYIPSDFPAGSYQTGTYLYGGITWSGSTSGHFNVDIETTLEGGGPSWYVENHIDPTLSSVSVGGDLIGDGQHGVPFEDGWNYSGTFPFYSGPGWSLQQSTWLTVNNYSIDTSMGFLFSLGEASADSVLAPAAIPEPATWLTLAGGLFLAGLRLRRR
jgi:hypothetical protein